MNMPRQTVMPETGEFAKIKSLVCDLRREGWDFRRQRRAREGGREKQVKESANKGTEAGQGGGRLEN